MQFDLIIKNGAVATVENIFTTDIGIAAGKIIALAENLPTANAKRTIDAFGKYVLPGGIDVHTHLDMPAARFTSCDDFATGTIAAACGGTTTIVDFCTQYRGQTLAYALETWHKKAKGKAVIDYGFHLCMTDVNDASLAELAQLIPNGYPSIKLLMAYDLFRVDDMGILKVLECAKKYNGLVCVHPENYHAINYMVEKFKRENKIAPKYHPLSRPPIVEAEAAGRAIMLAQLIDAPLYIVHLTCKEVLDEVIRAREQGLRVMAETCPQYLLLSDDKYQLDDFDEVAKYVISPPLRPKANQEILWQGLREGNLQVVSTDHCPFNLKGQKDTGRNFFADIPNGIASIELRMALLFDRGVNTHKISLQKYVEITATNPAKIFGMYPRKGNIAVGADADVVIFDPNLKQTVTHSMLHENVDYTPYEGFEITGYPIMTLSRGKVIVENGKFIGQPGAGQFIARCCQNPLFY